jgi:hypothetical protein
MISFTPNYQLRVNSTKSTIGNLQGAAGAVEAPATIKVSSSTSSTHIGDVSPNKLYMKKEFHVLLLILNYFVFSSYFFLKKQFENTSKI